VPALAVAGGRDVGLRLIGLAAEALRAHETISGNEPARIKEAASAAVESDLRRATMSEASGSGMDRISRMLGDEETTTKRLVAHSDNRRLEILTILPALGVDLDLSSVSQSLDSRSRLGPA
jgi:hypothetical protein